MARSPGLSFHQAVSLTEIICDVAGSRDMINEAQRTLRKAGVVKAVQNRNTATIFDWLMEAMSYQGVSDQVAEGYMEKHGAASYRAIEIALARGETCPKLDSYWQFTGCGYRKNERRCSRQELLPDCPLPRLDLRNGILNQAAYSLFLFLRDICDGDFVGWVDSRLASAASDECDGDFAIIEPMRHIHGVSSKVLNMTLATFLLGADRKRWLWKAVGGRMIAIDTLVHAWLHRTGILRGVGAEHPYGPACYSGYRCREIIRRIATEIDGRAFNIEYPRVFPRFVQQAIWRFCAQQELNQCNGNKLDDTRRCDRFSCIAYDHCKRLVPGPIRSVRAT